jgi:hypothetical protein
MFLLFWLMYVDFSSLFVKFEPYKAFFDKYVLEFTSKQNDQNIYYVSPSNEGRHIVLVWFFLLLLGEACPDHKCFVFPDSVKKILKNWFCLMLCTKKFDLSDVGKKWFSTDMEKKYIKHENPSNLPPLL